MNGTGEGRNSEHCMISVSLFMQAHKVLASDIASALAEAGFLPPSPSPPPPPPAPSTCPTCAKTLVVFGDSISDAGVDDEV